MNPAPLFFRVCITWILAMCAAAFLARIERNAPPADTSHPLQSYPAPLYQPWTLPGTTDHGLDFAQIYFPSLALRAGDSPYTPADPAYRDPENRVPGYPPFSLLLTLPFLELGYGGALRVHLALQAAVFIGATLLFLRQNGLRGDAPRILGLCAGLLFLTPVGRTFFERGQCDLYAASAILLGFTALLASKNVGWIAAAAGILAGIKWTAIPPLGAFAGIGLLVQRRRFGLWILSGFAATLAAFPQWQPAFLATLRHWERQKPDGIAADRLWMLAGAPLGTSKLVFVMAGLLLIAGLRRTTASTDKTALLAAGTAAVVMGTCIGSVVWEYRVIALLGMVPPLWLLLKSAASSVRARLAATLLALFLLAAFRCLPWLWLPTGWQAALHLAAGLSATAAAFYWIRHPGRIADCTTANGLKDGGTRGEAVPEP